jgi:hypothetical protein
MGLVSDEVDGETRYAALTDILGAEDALGDMDFKVAGTKDFITAIQLDTKLDGIPASVLKDALAQAKVARLAILDVIDRVPSIDPFLLKTRFYTLKIAVPEGCLRISEHEELATRQLIENKLSTVITKSFEKFGGISPDRMRHAIDVIWDPSREDASRFLVAFGFRLTEAPELFFALQGITFYEALFNDLRDRLEGLMAWLTGPAAAPEDIRSHPRHEAQRHAMLVSEVSGIIRRSVAEVVGVFATFDDAIRRFERSDDPSPLRAFLAFIRRHFWRIGHVLTAIINACITVEERKLRTRGTEKVAGSVETLLFVKAIMGDSAEGYRATLTPR